MRKKYRSIPYTIHFYKYIINKQRRMHNKFIIPGFYIKVIQIKIGNLVNLVIKFFTHHMDIESVVKFQNFREFQLRKYSLSLEGQFVCVLPALNGSVVIVQEHFKQGDHRNQRQTISHIDKKGDKIGSISYKYSSGQYCIINNINIIRLGIPFNKVSDYSEVLDTQARQSKYFQLSLTDWNLVTHDQDNFTLKEPVQENNLRSIVLYSFPLTKIVAYMLEYYQPQKQRLQYRFKTYRTPISQDKGYTFKPLIYKFPRNRLNFSGNHPYRCTKLNDQHKLVLFPSMLDISDKIFQFVSINLIKGQIKQYRFEFPQDFPSRFDIKNIKVKNKDYLVRACFQSDVWEIFKQKFYLRFQTTQGKIKSRKSWTYYWDSKTGEIVSPADQPININYYAIFSNTLRLNQYFYDKGTIYHINLNTLKMSRLDMPEKRVQRYKSYGNRKVFSDYHPRVLISNFKNRTILRAQVYEYLEFPYSHQEYIAFMVQQLLHGCDKQLLKMVIRLTQLDQYQKALKQKHHS